jgi:hypothetical protein
MNATAITICARGAIGGYSSKATVRHLDPTHFTDGRDLVEVRCRDAAGNVTTGVFSLEDWQDALRTELAEYARELAAMYAGAN